MDQQIMPGNATTSRTPIILTGNNFKLYKFLLLQILYVIFNFSASHRGLPTGIRLVPVRTLNRVTPNSTITSGTLQNDTGPTTNMTSVTNTFNSQNNNTLIFSNQTINLSEGGGTKTRKNVRAKRIRVGAQKANVADFDLPPPPTFPLGNSSCTSNNNNSSLEPPNICPIPLESVTAVSSREYQENSRPTDTITEDDLLALGPMDDDQLNIETQDFRPLPFPAIESSVTLSSPPVQNSNLQYSTILPTATSRSTQNTDQYRQPLQALPSQNQIYQNSSLINRHTVTANHSEMNSRSSATLGSDQLASLQRSNSFPDHGQSFERRNNHSTESFPDYSICKKYNELAHFILNHLFSFVFRGIN